MTVIDRFSGIDDTQTVREKLNMMLDYIEKLEARIKVLEGK